MASERSYKRHLGQKEDTEDLSRIGGDSGGKKDTKRESRSFFISKFSCFQGNKEKKTRLSSSCHKLD